MEIKIKRIAVLIGFKFNTFRSNAKHNYFILNFGYDKTISIRFISKNTYEFIAYISNVNEPSVFYRSIKCSLNRNIISLSNDIKKRLLFGYDDAVNKYKEEIKRKNKKNEHRRIVIDSVVRYFNLKDHNYNKSIKTFDFSGVSGSVELNLNELFNLKLNDLSPDKLMQVLTVVNGVKNET